jgi:peptidoglycan/LPS O-acetylase OafA/YrhL
MVVAFVVAIYDHASFKSFLFTGSTLFGFMRPNAYIVTGAWSIGNEMVYYVFTPLVIVSFNKGLKYGNILTLLALGLSIYFSFFLLNADMSLEQQWSNYINPFNNLFLYLAGIALYYNLKDIEISKKINFVLLLFCILFFIFFPVSGDLINIVTGKSRLLFVFTSILLVFCFWKANLKLPSAVSNILLQ